MPSGAFAFGAYHLDSASRRLLRDGQPVALTDRQFEVLLQLVTQAGTVLSKDALIAAAWDDVAVTDNSLEQAISALRRAMGPSSDGRPFIETVPRRGYRFTAPVTRTASRERDEDLDALLLPHRVWLEGRVALESLALDQVAVAQAAFEHVLGINPDYAPGHLGLANACAFRFETTRADAMPDVVSLERAVHHAREARRLDPSTAESWATLAFVIRHHDPVQALAAARHAASLEPDNWRHQLRLAYVTWGEERLRAADRTLKLLPGLALAHWLAATVHIARQAFDAAERELDAGARAQDSQRAGASRFSGVGLHWLWGLLHLQRGDVDAARHAFEHELSFEHSGHLYARECAANTWYSLGAMAFAERDMTRAVQGMMEALRRVRAHPQATAALQALMAAGHAQVVDTLPDVVRPNGRVAGAVDAAVAEAIIQVAQGHHARAAAIVRSALTSAPIDASGWLLPVDPFIQPMHRVEWAPVLALLRTRAA